ncbi:embryogenesis-associated protein EMB8 isoform X1 [Musa acuminata AAA Group]|uniref:embryogenesis-associated protein EMB8 isoform X1 n=1 Tax=Musa acuminata AAA Group TaxID=214697 RepID=UPI0031D8FD21
MASYFSSVPDEASAIGLLLQAAALVPTAHYLAAALIFLLVFLYNFLELHFLGDFLRGFRGDPVVLTFDPASRIYQGVVSMCRILHGRYLVTPWLASPHLQTVFLSFFGRPPSVVYRRQLFSVQDGGTVALDWLLASDVAGGASDTDKVISRDDTTPIVVVVPGLTSDSFSSYVKHAAYTMAKHGWNVVVSNHRGLGGISITSDCFYNAGWTEDLREVVNYLHYEYWRAPLFAVGTSIGANVLVKYLGEDGENTPIAGAVSVCSPWDLVVCDRFISRKLVQRFYDKALTIGLKGYAQLHQPILTRLANWEGIRKSCSVRDFDSHATCHVGKFEVFPLATFWTLFLSYTVSCMFQTVDTYYRCCSSVSFIGNVAVPLLCISSLDDPVCTREAIPWDECRANQNIVLATTAHGGHLAYFEGLTAHSLWWVGAVREFLNVLHSSEFMHGQIKTPNHGLHCSLESAIDKGPYVNITEDGMVAAMTSEGPDHMTEEDLHDDELCHVDEPEDEIVLTDQSLLGTENDMDNGSEPVDSVQEIEAESITKAIHDVTAPVKRSINQLLQHYDISMWLLAYIAIVTTWPLLGSALSVVFKRKLRGLLPVPWLRR